MNLRGIANQVMRSRGGAGGVGGRPTAGGTGAGGVGGRRATGTGGRRGQDEAIGRGVRGLLRRFR